MTALVLSLTAAALVLAVLAWIPKSGSTVEIVISGVMLACLGAVGVLLLAGDEWPTGPSAGGTCCSCSLERSQ